MPRQPRFILPGHPQHVIVRGNDRRAVFMESADYKFFLAKLREALEMHACSLHAYVLMTNHVHLLISPADDVGISKVMQSVGRSYVQYFNRKQKRTGTLWEGRFKAALVDSERYLLTCYRYIELNPVRAGLVDTPDQYRWSSYASNVQGTEDSIVTPHEVYLRLGRNRLETGVAYKALFDGHLCEKELAAIRDATNKCWALGSEEFKLRLGKCLNRRLAPLPRGGQTHGNKVNGV
ncbi:MAG: transposase [Gammaproteobacteria bacterium]|nr:transposase [Gammaproteobacteria bacterium]